MKRTVTILFLALVTCLHLLAVDSLESLEQLKQKLPDLKDRNFVGTLTHDGKKYYIVKGQAEKFFGGAQGEQDWELYQEAELRAKMHFLQALTKGQPNLMVTVRHVKAIHHVNDGTCYTAILAVPMDQVTITERPPEPPPKVPLGKPDQPVRMSPPLTGGTTEKKTDKPAEVPMGTPKAKTVSGNTGKATGPDSKPANKAATSLSQAPVPAPDSTARLQRKITVYRKRIAETSDNPYLFHLLGKLYEQLHEPDKALDCYMSMLRILLKNKDSLAESLKLMEATSLYAEQNNRFPTALKCQRLIQKMGNKRQRQQATIHISRLNVKSRIH